MIRIIFTAVFVAIILGIFYRVASADVKKPIIKKPAFPCREQYKEVRLAQLRLDLALVKYGSCIEVLTEPSNEFLND